MSTKEQLNQAEIEALLNELESKMQRLRMLYEQYFLGIERKPPTTLRMDVFRIVNRFESIYIRNTAQKFRLRSLVQRFSSYTSYWGRVERQIEEGTYTRDINRARRRTERRESQGTGDDGLPILELDLELDAVDDLQAELEEMERAGAFEKFERKFANEPKAPAPVQAVSAEEAEARRQAKLAEIRRQLMADMGGEPAQPEPVRPSASSPPAAAAAAAAASAGPVDERQAKLDRLKSRLGGGAAREVAPAQSEIRGADSEKLRQLAAMKAKIEAERQAPTSMAPTSTTPPAASAPSDGAGRTIQRPTVAQTGAQRVVQRPTAAPADDEAKRVYDKLIATKRQLNESTQGLSYEQVKQSMQTQREQLRQSRGASDVDFQVVVKDGRAFLKPVPK